MSVARQQEFDALVLELNRRYQDVPKPARATVFFTAAMAMSEAFCLEKTRRPMTEDEFVSLARDCYRRVHP